MYWFQGERERFPFFIVQHLCTSQNIYHSGGEKKSKLQFMIMKIMIKKNMCMLKKLHHYWHPNSLSYLYNIINIYQIILI